MWTLTLTVPEVLLGGEKDGEDDGAGHAEGGVGGHLSIFRYIFQSVHLGLQSRSTEIYIDTPHTFITV